MQITVIFSLIVAACYFLANIAINSYSSCRDLKDIAKDSCLVFLSVISSSFLAETFGILSLSSQQNGGSVTAAFTKSPDF